MAASLIVATSLATITTKKYGGNMSQFRWISGLLLGGSVALSCISGAQAQNAYKIGMSAGLTGYAATVDRAWRDGVEVAIATLNARGGIMGRKIELVVEDNR